MKELPILFQGEQVKGIMGRRKSQTRRVVKGKWLPLVLNVLEVNGKWVWDTLDYELTTPYGRPGDRLWVRETWLPDPSDDDTWDYCMYSDGVIHNLSAIPRRFKYPEYVIYKASWDGPDLKWRPSIFMPRWASRIILEVVNVRVERVQEISEEDCIAEGMSRVRSFMRYGQTGDRLRETIQWEYKELWNDINAKRGYGWNSNPLVWVIEFKEVSRNGG